MRAAGYFRVSTEEQTEGYSIDAQRRGFQALCQGRDWTPIREYVDEGKSARTDQISKRPAFKQMIDDGLAGQFDVLVVHKLDRFSRNLRITVEYFEKLSKAGVTFVSLSEMMDFSQPWGQFSLNMLGALAQFYSDNLSYETKKGWRERKEQGLYCGALPFGAKKAKEGDRLPNGEKAEEGVPIPDPDTHAGLVMAFQVAAEGKSYRDVAHSLNLRGFRTAGTRGNRPFTKDTMPGLLQNRFYIGELPDSNGGWLKGKHAPLIDEALFVKVQKQIAERSRTREGSVRRRARTYSLTGVVHCASCGSKMTIHTNKDDKARMYCRGRAHGKRCTCKGTYLELYESQLEWYLQTFVIPPDYREKVLDVHRKLAGVYDDAEKQRRHLEGQMTRLQEQYEWGHIARDAYLDKYNTAKRELALLTPPEVKDGKLDKIARFLENVSEGWHKGTPEQRNRLALALFDQIVVEDNRIIGVKPKDDLRPFFQLSHDAQPHSSTSALEAHRGRHVLLFGEGFMETFPVCAPAKLLTRSWPGRLPRSVWPQIVRQSKTKTLRDLADEYEVSHESIRRTLAAASGIPA